MHTLQTLQTEALLLPLCTCRQKPSNIPEFNRSAAELCAAANNSEGYGNPRAWGWASAGCQTAVPFMCKMQGALTVGWAGWGACEATAVLLPACCGFGFCCRAACGSADINKQ